MRMRETVVSRTVATQSLSFLEGEHLDHMVLMLRAFTKGGLQCIKKEMLSTIFDGTLSEVEQMVCFLILTAREYLVPKDQGSEWYHPSEAGLDWLTQQEENVEREEPKLLCTVKRFGEIDYTPLPSPDETQQENQVPTETASDQAIPEVAWDLRPLPINIEVEVDLGWL